MPHRHGRLRPATDQKEHTMSPDPTVNIVDANSGAIKVYADAITVGDALFDVFGGTHKVTHVANRDPKIYVKRDDNWADTFRPDTEITILPDGNVDRMIDNSASVSRQHFIDTGRYLTLGEMKEIPEADGGYGR
jgi:hypothetical protein